MSIPKYKCLVLDHDDTTVDSTRHIHYPAFMQVMEKLRPGLSVTLDEYFEANCCPGFFPYMLDVLKLTPEEMEYQNNYWRTYSALHQARMYPGVRELIRRQRALGGYVCVVSHNVDANILRSYRDEGLPPPDLIYGSDLPPGQVKPSAYPLLDIMKRLSLEPHHLIVVDDLLPGFRMAQAAGVDFAAACWAYRGGRVKETLLAEGALCYDSPEDLMAFLGLC